MTESETLQSQIRALQAKLAPLQEQERQLKEAAKQSKLARMEEIGREIRKLVDEAEATAREMDMTFYRDTYVQAVDDDPGKAYYGNREFWQASEYC